MTTMRAKWAKMLAAAGVKAPDSMPLEIDPAYALDAADLVRRGLVLG